MFRSFLTFLVWDSGAVQPTSTEQHTRTHKN